MTIRQLSIFIENKSGALVEVLDRLKEAGISLIASNIADTVEYGICRILCDDPERAYNVLKDSDTAVAVSDVFAIELDNRPGTVFIHHGSVSREGAQLRLRKTGVGP